MKTNYSIGGYNVKLSQVQSQQKLQPKLTKVVPRKLVTGETPRNSKMKPLIKPPQQLLIDDQSSRLKVSASVK